MKNLIFAIFILMSPLIKAQTVFDNIVDNELKEEYLMDLFRNCKVIYCDVDIDDDMKFIKKMEVEFVDSTYFFSAYVCSTPYDKRIHSADTYSCDFVQMDDGGNGFEIEGNHLNDLPDLKAVLDSLLYNTKFKKYEGDPSDMD